MNLQSGKKQNNSTFSMAKERKAEILNLWLVLLSVASKPKQIHSYPKSVSYMVNRLLYSSYFYCEEHPMLEKSSQKNTTQFSFLSIKISILSFRYLGEKKIEA